ncbi:hypothetical protein HPB52_010999 [Rhipicephalus sanguineus]|uniref:Tick transposon n=1 Tax=Rhipicephalus sanguineus TaxID=34632 RepID=A0A9D4PLP6_RHISA|nr:hypothetical protein HPB52_010999 [Rhipicephalus sanguineus]
MKGETGEMMTEADAWTRSISQAVTIVAALPSLRYSASFMTRAYSSGIETRQEHTLTCTQNVDSRTALLALARGERGALIAQRLFRKFTVIQNSGCDLAFQWVPSHAGVQGNEAADALAKEGHDPRTPVTSFARVSDVARLIIARHLRSLHPDARVASGNPPRLLPRAGLNRRARAFFLRLRIGCSRTAEHLFRLSGSGNPTCVQCPADEIIDHILLQCP